jgi:lipopolysaccharide biosynthesis glycosyltransferase
MFSTASRHVADKGSTMKTSPRTEPRTRLTLVSNADTKFFPGLVVALASALATASGRCDYRVLILDGGIEAADFEGLCGLLENIARRRGVAVATELLKVDQSRLAALPERRGSRMTYAKLVLPEILPDIGVAIYVDADMLFFRGVEEICPKGAGNWLLAGVRDYFAVLENECPWLDQLPIADRKLPYINCGVMWMNLEGLRRMDFTTYAIAARAQLPNARQGDQSVFNFICRGRIDLLDEGLNHRTGLGSNQPLNEGDLNINLHYIGAPKPWLGAPKTNNWLAHTLWHQACAAFYPDAQNKSFGAVPTDLDTARRKAFWYSLINPRRGAAYRGDLASLEDPAGVIGKSSAWWRETLRETTAD